MRLKHVLIMVIILGALMRITFGNGPGGHLRTVGRTVAPMLCGAAALGLLLGWFRRDDVPDYLRRLRLKIATRGGLCVALRATAIDGVAMLEVWFQSQREAPCSVRIGLRPALSFLMKRAPLRPLVVEFECPPAGFGVVHVPLPVPAACQGRSQSFEIGMDVHWPDRTGRRVRFRDGFDVMATSEFTYGMKGVATLMAFTGSGATPEPQTMRVELPAGVAEHTDVVDDVAPGFTILWQLGDPPLDHQVFGDRLSCDRNRRGAHMNP